MRILKCYVCSSNVYPGHGTIFIRNDALSFTFCRSKCRKVFEKKRNPRKIKWTKAYRHLHNKEPHSTLGLEQRRHEPIFYDRDIFQSVYEALPRINELNEKHNELFIKERVLTGREKMKKHEIAFIVKHKTLCKEGELFGDIIKSKKREFVEEDEKEKEKVAYSE